MSDQHIDTPQPFSHHLSSNHPVATAFPAASPAHTAVIPAQEAAAVEPLHLHIFSLFEDHCCKMTFYLFIYLGFYVAFNTVQVISRRVVGRAEETSTYSSLGLCTVNCRPTASNYQLPLEAVTGIEPRPQRWEARVLPLK